MVAQAFHASTWEAELRQSSKLTFCFHVLTHGNMFGLETYFSLVS